MAQLNRRRLSHSTAWWLTTFDLPSSTRSKTTWQVEWTPGAWDGTPSTFSLVSPGDLEKTHPGILGSQLSQLQQSFFTTLGASLQKLRLRLSPWIRLWVNVRSESSFSWKLRTLKSRIRIFRCILAATKTNVSDLLQGMGWASSPQTKQEKTSIFFQADVLQTWLAALQAV